MCGITGYFSLNGEKVKREYIEMMLASIRHRGPDDQGIFLKDNFGFGMQRLSIIDLVTGNQPIHNEDNRLWIVSNGEIYNYKILRSVLCEKGHSFTTNSDTEVILHLYEEYGTKCLDKLEGMFAFAVWDTVNEELFLARDRMGQKPLYYSLVSSQFVFGSEIKAILQASALERRLSFTSLEKYLFFGFVPTPNTIFRDIYQVPAGSYLLIKKGKELLIKSYWEPEYNNRSKVLDESEIERRCIKLIKKSVEKCMVSDVPVGTFLSGGVDSSLVTAIMCEMAGNQNVDTFTIGFSEKQHDESFYAKLVARKLGIKNHHIKIFSVNECLDIIPEILGYMDMPMADPSLLPTYLLSKFTKGHVKVVLGGDGGDELFAGYPKYFAHQIAKPIEMVGKGIAKPVLGLLERGLVPFLDKKKMQFLRGLSFPSHIRNHIWIAPFYPEEIEKLIRRDIKKELFEDIESYYNRIDSDDMTSKMLYLDGKLTFSDLYLVKVDRASMANSLEVRSPLLDRDLMEFVNRLPTSFKLRRGKSKFLLKKIAARFLPREAIYRKKMGFGIPLKEWITKGLRDLIEEYLSSERIKRDNIFSYEEINNLLQEHHCGKEDNSTQIWTLLVFQYWYHEFAVK